MPIRRFLTIAAAVLVALTSTAGAQLEKLAGTTPRFRANLQTDMILPATGTVAGGAQAPCGITLRKGPRPTPLAATVLDGVVRCGRVSGPANASPGQVVETSISYATPLAANDEDYTHGAVVFTSADESDVCEFAGTWAVTAPSSRRRRVGG